MRRLPSDPRFAKVTDEALIDLAGQGDHAAIVEFLVRHWDEFVGIARSRIRESGDFTHGIDDLMSTTTRQVMTLVMRKRFIADGVAKAHAFVAKVLRRAISRTVVRGARERRRLCHRRSQVEAFIRDASDDERERRREQIEAHLRHLNDRDWQVLAMRLRGVPHEKIAAALGCSDAAARKRSSAVSQRLAQLFADEE